MCLQKDDTIVRRYAEEDYSDITEAGYPFDTCLKPNLRGRL